MKCKICNEEKSKLGIHLKYKHNMTIEQYYLKFYNNKNLSVCLYCGGKTKFNSIEKGYNTYCSSKCKNSCPIYKEKYKQTILEKYGVDNVQKSKIVQDKTKQTCIKKYGHDCSLHNNDVKEKVKDTLIKKYGVDNPLKSEMIKSKVVNTNLEKYGTKCVFQNENIKEKIKTSLIENYGVTNPMQSESIKDNIKKACIEKHGVDHNMKRREVKEKVFMKHKISVFKRLVESDRLKEKCIPNFNIDEYNGVSDGKKYSWKCMQCNNIFYDHIDDGHIPRCFKCNPKLKGISFIEKELYSEILKFNKIIIENDRSLISPKEIDIYIPECKLAIELNGLYWHSELNGMGKDYHLNKLINCQNAGVSLIQIFEDEWVNKKDIVISIIKSKMKILSNKIYARKCIIKEVDNNERNMFLENNHLQGFINGKSIGLYYNNELVSILVFGSPRFDKKYDCEILRYCCKKDFSVIGGLSKLINYLLSNYSYKNIMTYVDRRYGTGEGYLNCGFKYVSTSDPSYYYIKDSVRLNRLNFQKCTLKDKLDVYDESLTEWQNMQANGYNRIWDCGNIKYQIINEKVVS